MHQLRLEKRKKEMHVRRRTCAMVIVNHARRLHDFNRSLFERLAWLVSKISNRSTSSPSTGNPRCVRLAGSIRRLIASTRTSEMDSLKGCSSFLSIRGNPLHLQDTTTAHYAGLPVDRKKSDYRTVQSGLAMQIYSYPRPTAFLLLRHP